MISERSSRFSVLSSFQARTTRILAIVLLLNQSSITLKAQDNADDAVDQNTRPVAFKVTGTVEGVKQTRVEAATEQHTTLIIETIIPHGATVSELSLIHI